LTYSEVFFNNSKEWHAFEEVGKSLLTFIVNNIVMLPHDCSSVSMAQHMAKLSGYQLVQFPGDYVKWKAWKIGRIKYGLLEKSNYK